MGRRKQKERETHIAGEELDGHAQDEQEPEDVQALQHQQEAIKEVITKEGRIDGDWIDPGTVHDPETERELKRHRAQHERMNHIRQTSGRYMERSPEREDHESGDEEDDGKDDEDVVTGLSPAGVVKHFG